MMKNTFLVYVLFLSFNLYSQNKTRNEIIDLITQDTCDCIKNDPDSYSNDKTLNQKKVSLGLCMVKSFNVRKLESAEMKDSGINNFESLGEEIGLNLISFCGTEFMAIFTDDQLGILAGEASEEDDFAQIPPPPAPKNENDLKLEASLVSLNNDAISYIKVNDEFDKEHIFLINEQFEGFELLKKSNFGKDFKIYYKEIDLFDLSERKYVKKKVVKYLELI